MSLIAYRLMAAAGVTFISFAPILIRASAEAGDVTIAFYRSLYALPFLGIFYWRSRASDQRPRQSRVIAMAAGVFLALDLTFWHASIRQIGAGLATLLVNLQVVFVALIAWAFFAEKPGRRAVAVLPIVLVGVVLISGVVGDEAYGSNPVLGSTQSVFAALMYALYILLLRQSGKGHATPAAGPVLDATVGTVIATFAIGTFVASDFDTALDWPVHGWILLLAIVVQAFGWPLIAKAMPHLPALDTSILLLGQPMLAILWAGLIYNEALATSQWLGVGLVLAGLVAFSLRKTEPTAGSNDAIQDVVEPIDDSV